MRVGCAILTKLSQKQRKDAKKLNEKRIKKFLTGVLRNDILIWLSQK